PSIWYEAVAAPQTKSCGKWLMTLSGMRFLSDQGGWGGDVAACALPHPRFDERWRDSRADVDRKRAAADEAAALGRIDRRGGKSFVHLDLRPLADRRIGDGREQQLGVGMQRR